MEQLNAVNKVEIDQEQLAVEELKALFPRAGKTPRAALAVKVEDKEKPLFFERFRGKIQILIN